MSPSKQKSKERQAARDRKVASARQTANGATGASAYNPSSGTFHALHSVVSSEAGLGYFNGRFKTIEDDDNASSNGGTTELECMSNNGSCSGESEDQKEKQSTGKSANQADKREKVRGKNERKHQRQKERRAQELRDKCTSYLMSRKLESLSQQLVAMGFSQERATMALIFNDGHVEHSVAWLLEGGESQVKEDWNAGNNPKIDISDELGRILEIEKKYKFLRPEIERAIVSCEGDLEKALECLRMHSQSNSTGHDEEAKLQGDVKDPGITMKGEARSQIPLPVHVQAGNDLKSKGTSVQNSSSQTKRDERFSSQSSKGKVQPTSTINFSAYEASPKATTLTQRSFKPLSDIQNSVLPLERRSYAHGETYSSGPAKVSAPHASHFPPISKIDTGLILLDTTKLTSGPARENAAFKNSFQNQQMKQANINLKTASSNPTVSSSAFPVSDWCQNMVDVGSLSNVLYSKASDCDASSKMQNRGRNNFESYDIGRVNPQSHHNLVGLEPSSYRWGSWIGNGPSISNESSAQHPLGASTMTTYGLFTGWGAGLSHSSADWSTGPTSNFDYRNIDWSMNASSTTTMHRLSSSFNSFTLQGANGYYWNNDEEKRLQTQTGVSGYVTEPSWKMGSLAVLQENTSNASGNKDHEWTSPFAGKDLFNIPQAVPSPSL